MAPMDEEEDTRLPEENQEVDPSITLCHKIFLLSNPDPVSYTHLPSPRD